VAFNIPYVYDFITHTNITVQNIGQGKAMYGRYVRELVAGMTVQVTKLS